MFEGIIKEYTLLNKNYIKKEETIFEICGFPHFEVVSSNVLAFFLDKNKEHSLGALFIDSLLSIINIATISFDGDYSVERECPTKNGNYIDIMISDSESAIVIENKIFASLNNDLEDYIETVKKDHANCIGVIISLYKIESDRNDFVSITYDELFAEVKKRYGSYLHNGKLNYLSLMFDFIRNISELKGENTMNLEFIEFIKEHKSDVEEFGRDIKNLHDEFRRTVNKVNSIVSEKIDNNKIKLWVWRELPSFIDIAVSDITIKKDTIIALNSIIDINGWRYELFMRNNESGTGKEILEFCTKKGIDGDLNEEHRFQYDKTYPLETNLDTISDEIVSIINKIIG